MNDQAKHELAVVDGFHRRAKRKFATMDYEVLEDGARRLDLSPRDLCKAIGYSRDVVKGWHGAGRIPQVAGLAIEALISRTSTEDAHDTFLVRIGCEHSAALLGVVKGLEGEACEIKLSGL